MPPHRPISPVEAKVLYYLRDEALYGCGWLRKGVRGWRLYPEIKAATEAYFPERLPYLAKRGLLDRLDVREPGKERTTQLYRISEQGARLVAELEGPGKSRLPSRPKTVDENEGTFYIPVLPWSALRTLRMYAAERAGPIRLGEHGWLTLAEIRRADRRLCGDDLKWLLTRQLIERREIPDLDRPERSLVVYRATEQGQRTEPVEMIHSPGNLEYIALRVREEQGHGCGESDGGSTHGATTRDWV